MEQKKDFDHCRNCRAGLLIAASIYFTSGKAKLNVDTERITISEVKKGSFPGIYSC